MGLLTDLCSRKAVDKRRVPPTLPDDAATLCQEAANLERQLRYSLFSLSRICHARGRAAVLAALPATHAAAAATFLGGLAGLWATLLAGRDARPARRCRPAADRLTRPAAGRDTELRTNNSRQ